MNIKLANKDLRNNFSTIVSCGYAELSSLLYGKEKAGYNCGVYGWNYASYAEREKIVKDFEKALIMLVNERLAK